MRASLERSMRGSAAAGRRWLGEKRGGGGGLVDAGVAREILTHRSSGMEAGEAALSSPMAQPDGE